MIFSWYQHLPLYINPTIFTAGSFSVRWYAIMYLASFIVAYFILLWRVKQGECFYESPGKTENAIIDFLLVAFFSSLVGGRIGYVLFYNFSYFAAHPLAIISPYDAGGGHFVGLYGMSYHGALVGIVIGSYVFLRIKKINFWKWADFVSVVAPLGYFFGRIGNFLNGELYGRITTSPLGMYFANDSLTLRHPSQIYEAILEGLVLFAILWKIRNIKLPEGRLFSIYLIGYGILRIFAEQFRQPDSQVGFIWGCFTMGQLLSFLMIISGITLWMFKKQKK
jgi:phosphatidylglycerol---prolipoprotein diacylglyceryl transferase